MERNEALEKKLFDIDQKIHELENKKNLEINQAQNLKTSEKYRIMEDESQKRFKAKIEAEKKTIVEKLKSYKDIKTANIICPKCFDNIDVVGVDRVTGMEMKEAKQPKLIFMLNDGKIIFCPVCGFEMRKDFDFRDIKI